MTAKELLRSVMQTRGKTYREVGERAGMRAQEVSDRVNRMGISVDNLIRILDALDCDIVIQSRTNYKESWVLDEATKKLAEKPES